MLAPPLVAQPVATLLHGWLGKRSPREPAFAWKMSKHPSSSKGVGSAVKRSESRGASGLVWYHTHTEHPGWENGTAAHLHWAEIPFCSHRRRASGTREGRLRNAKT